MIEQFYLSQDLFMRVKEEMAKVIILDNELTRLDSDNTSLENRVSISDHDDEISVKALQPTI